MVKLISKLALLGLLIIAGQFALYAIQPSRPMPLLIREVRDARRCTYVFLGDSVNATASATDTNRASISRMLAGKLGSRLAGLSRGGFDLLLYRDIVLDILRHPKASRTVIIEVNIAGLNGDGRTPYTEHQEIAFELRKRNSIGLRVFDRPLHVFRVPALRPAIRLEEHLHKGIFWQGRQVGKQRDFEGARFLVPEVTDDLVRQNLILRYGQPISPGNRMLEAATEIARRLTSRGHRAVFFLTPVNHGRCDAYWNGEISPILREKARAARAAVEAGGGELLDLTFALGPEYFDPAHYPNEHLKEAGRDWVAQALADYLRR